MAPHSSTFAWKIPWMEEPGGLQSVGSLRVGHDWASSLSLFTFTFHFHALEKEMATHPSVLAWRIPGTGEPGGLLSMGSYRIGHDWSDIAAAAHLLRKWIYFLVHSASPQTTMTAVSTLMVSHTALLLNQIFQNSLSSVFLHWVGYKSYTPGKFQEGCEITSL